MSMGPDVAALPGIRAAQSRATDAGTAVSEFHALVSQPDTGLVVFFCSSDYDLDALAQEMNRRFAGIPVVGCTTAGEIGPLGYCERSLSGASFPVDVCTAVTDRLGDLQHFGIAKGQAFIQELLTRFESRAPGADPRNSFGFLLIDGLSVREEQVTNTLQYALDRISLFGGSAGDGQRFGKTHVYHDGRFHADSAVLILMNTSLPFRIFQTQHFVSRNERLVVTEADTASRIVREINGLPAAQEYARAIGVNVRDLDSAHFAAAPVVVRLDGMNYVRSVQKTNADGSLTFYCAIEEGLVFRVAHGEDLVGNLERTFDRLRAEIGPPQFVIGCDCILRNLEITQAGLKGHVEQVFRQNHVVGFSTYGEQIRGTHVNQTLTGVAIGRPREGHYV